MLNSCRWYEFTLRQQPDAANFPVAATMARVQVGEVQAKRASVNRRELGDAHARSPRRSRPAPDLADEAAGKERGAFFVEARRVK